MKSFDSRTKNCEVGLRILFHNGLPKVGFNGSKKLRYPASVAAK